MMRRIIKRIIVFFGAVIIALAISVGLFYYSILPPRAQVIVDRFSTHRASYERLREMIQADPQIDRLAAQDTEPAKSPPIRSPPAAGLSPDRYNEYMSLLKRIGAEEVGRRSREPLDIYVGIWASGWAGDTVHIDVRWMSQKPDHLVESADDFDNASIHRRGDLIYMHIDDNWYLVKDW